MNTLRSWLYRMSNRSLLLVGLLLGMGLYAAAYFVPVAVWFATPVFATITLGPIFLAVLTMLRESSTAVRFGWEPPLPTWIHRCIATLVACSMMVFANAAGHGDVRLGTSLMAQMQIAQVVVACFTIFFLYAVRNPHAKREKRMQAPLDRHLRLI